MKKTLKNIIASGALAIASLMPLESSSQDYSHPQPQPRSNTSSVLVDKDFSLDGNKQSHNNHYKNNQCNRHGIPGLRVTEIPRKRPVFEIKEVPVHKSHIGITGYQRVAPEVNIHRRALFGGTVHRHIPAVDVPKFGVIREQVGTKQVRSFAGIEHYTELRTNLRPEELRAYNCNACHRR